jgi:hypothetical protein
MIPARGGVDLPRDQKFRPHIPDTNITADVPARFALSFMFNFSITPEPREELADLVVSQIWRP